MNSNKALLPFFIILLISIINYGFNTTQCQGDRTCTQIYIINGDHEGEQWFDGPSKSEFLQALTAYPDHLFITPSLWKSFCNHRNKQLKHLEKEHITLDNLVVEQTRIYNKNNRKKSYCQDDDKFFYLATVVGFNEKAWDFFDTQKGLYYLRPKNNPKDIGLKIETFKKINDPFTFTAAQQQSNWVSGFMELFDLEKWHTVHKNGKKKIVCISGHGTQRTCKIARACGVPVDEFVKLMFYFNDTLCIDTLGVQSCYWPGMRILELMEQEKKKHFDFQLITPINKERVLYFAAEMPLVESYDPLSGSTEIRSSQGDSLLNGLHEIALSFDGTMNDELTKKLKSVHVVELNHSYNMKTCIINAKDTLPILV